MTRLFIILSFFFPISILAQPAENNAPDHAMQAWAEAYSMQSRMQKFKAEQKRFLENPAPVLLPEWESLGPNTLDTLSGRVICLTIDPNDSERLYIGSGSGGLWRSDNEGGSWVPLTDGLPSPHVSAIAVNPGNPDEILIGTGIGQVPTSTLAVGIGVLRSTDGGLTWEETSFSFTQAAQVSVYEIVWDAALPDKVILAATNGLYESTDGGQTWQNLIPNVRIYDFELHPDDPETMFAAVLNQGIRRSVDGGQTWENLDNGIPFGPQVSRSGIAICASEPDVMYASLISSSGFGLLGLYRSDDGGDSWTNLPNVPGFPCQPSAPSACSGWLFHTIAVAPDDPDVVLVGSVQFWRSADGGQTWTWRDYASNGSGGGNFGLTYVDNWDLDFHPTELGVVYVCNDGGVQKSTDYGHTWIRKSNDLVISQTYSIATQNDDPDFLIGGFHDHGLQKLDATNGNQTWKRWTTNDGIQTIIDHSDENILYGNIQYGTPYKSTSMGSGVQTTFPIANGINEPGAWMTPLEMDPRFSSVLYTSSNNRLYRTLNGGSFWQTVLENINTVRSIAINPLQPDTVFAHAFNSTSWSLWRSHDGGDDWEQVNATNIPSWGVTDLECSPHDAQTIYASRNSVNANMDHIKVSYDNGESWTDITNNLPDVMVWNILVSPLSPEHIYLATELGVYVSENAGESWEQWNNNLPTIEVYDVDYSPADSTIRIATMGRGIWKTAAIFPEVSRTSELDIWAENIAINIFPNPADGAVQVGFNLPQAGSIKLKLLNATGQRMKEWEYYLPSGKQNKRLEISELKLAAGVYFLRLENEGKAVHRKVIFD